MFYQQKAQKVFAFLKTNLPQFSIEHKWDSKLEAEWYFLQYERLQIRVLVPKIFFESNQPQALFLIPNLSDPTIFWEDYFNEKDLL